MSKEQSIKSRLVEVDDSMLVVIDVQDSFLDKYDNVKSQEVVARIVWLLQVAKLLDVAVVAMAEDIEHAGGLNRKVQDALPEGAVVHDKDAFGDHRVG